jgi:hypothetical protein
MATESSTSDGTESGRAGLKQNAKYYILSYPLAWLVFVFLVPLGMLFIFSFWVHVPGTGYTPGFTFENYARFFTSSLYVEQLWVTLELALVRYADRPDRCTITPRECPETERLTAWLSAENDGRPMESRMGHLPHGPA